MLVGVAVFAVAVVVVAADGSVALAVNETVEW